MKKSRKTTGKHISAKAAGGLLASAAGMLLPKIAEANTVSEPGPFTDSFPNNFASRQNLAGGVDGVNGFVNNNGEGGSPDLADYFVFTGYTPGASFTLDITFVSTTFGTIPLTLEWRAEPTGTLLNSTTVTSVNQMSSFVGIVPLNGNIAADVLLGTISGGFTGTYENYLVNFSLAPPNGNGNGVPESGGTMMLMGATVAGLALAKKLTRRKKRRQ